MKKTNKSFSYPRTDLVILAGGPARRMNGMNKLLQKFDSEIQLLKIYHKFKSRMGQIWVSSHRDHSIYKRLIASLQYYQDDQPGFLGPLMGMKSAWSHVEADYVLFIPCDVTYIPRRVVSRLHQALIAQPNAQVATVQINGKTSYPFCLMRRSSLAILQKHLDMPERNIKACFSELNMQTVSFKNRALVFHRINSLDELQQHRQLMFLG